MTSNTPTLDERLSAYLDDELTDAERAEIEMLLIEDDALGERLEALALADSDFIAFADEIDNIPMSSGLAELVARLARANSEAQPVPEMPVQADNVVAFPLWKRAMHTVVEHRAVAACVMFALIAAVFTPILTNGDRETPPPHSGSVILASSDLGELLSQKISGSDLTADNTRLTPALTFTRDDGSPCRVVNYAAPSMVGQFIACRAGEDWSVQTASYREISEDRPDVEFQSASGGSFPEIETWLDGALSDGPFNRDEEQALIDRNWTTDIKEN